MSLEFRVVKLGPMNGSFNTALDQVLFERASKEDFDPTIVFTQWRPTVSLGNYQSSKDVNHDFCRDNGIEVVRRISGGQAVHLDEGYIVFSLILPPSVASGTMKDYREFPIRSAESFLNSKGIPVRFHVPDNLVIGDGENVKTLGNSGQRISGLTGGPVMLHSSIRYSSANIPHLIGSLKFGDTLLHDYQSEIEGSLGCVTGYNQRIGREEITESIVQTLRSQFPRHRFVYKGLTSEEHNAVMETSNGYAVSGFEKEPSEYKSKGVCYFFLNGTNIVPKLRDKFPSSKPSTWRDSVDYGPRLLEATA